MNLSQNILKKIKNTGLKPRPKWQFILMHVFLWSFFVFSILLGGLAFTLILQFIFGTEWDIAMRFLPKGRFFDFFLILPYVWIATLALILFLSRFILLHTKKGYRFRPIYLVLVSLGLSLVLGGVLYFGDTPLRLEKAVRLHVPPYAALQNRRERVWNAPDEGVLAGHVVEIQSDVVFVLNTMTDEQWKVTFDSDLIPRGFILEKNMPLIILGDRTGEDTFDAEEIRPWRKPDFPMGPPPMRFLKENNL